MSSANSLDGDTLGLEISFKEESTRYSSVTAPNRSSSSRSISSDPESSFDAMDIDSDTYSLLGWDEIPSTGIHAASLRIDSSVHSPQPTSRDLLGPSSSLVQSKLPFKPIPRSEWLAQETQRFHDRQAEYEKERDRFELAQARLKVQQRKYEQLHKRAQRERKRQAQLTAGLLKLKDRKRLAHTTTSIPSQTIASLSRPYHKSSRNPKQTRPRGQQSEKVPSTPVNVNWTSPFLWSQIQQAAEVVGYTWKPTEIVCRLQKINPDAFSSLRPQRISRWRDRSCPVVLKWTEFHLKAIKAGDRPRGGGRLGSILGDHPDVISTITARLSNLRAAGVALDLMTIRGYMVDILRHHAPDTFSRMTPSASEICKGWFELAAAG